MQLRGDFFLFFNKQTCNVDLMSYMRVEVGLMQHLASAWGTLNFSIRACLLACMWGWRVGEGGNAVQTTNQHCL